MLNYIVTKFDALMMRNFSYKGWRNRRIKARVEREIAAHNEMARIEKQYADKVAAMMEELKQRYANELGPLPSAAGSSEEERVWEIYEGYARDYDAAYAVPLQRQSSCREGSVHGQGTIPRCQHPLMLIRRFALTCECTGGTDRNPGEVNTDQ